MRAETTSQSRRLLGRLAMVGLGFALAVSVTVSAHASDDPPLHDACGHDGGFVAQDAGVGEHTFSDPVVAPVRGARFEPSCSVSPTSRGASTIPLIGLLALGVLVRRRFDAVRTR